ncbi:hypothetical protein [Anabaena azotica]|uniref:Uncharacterized protein n=1 Tax=Anabaena azotica FACHB-119 TaxID=947527 RepID=A0ABR8DEB9_9NOST|nr:hypothetical protein [Anabaena azotica]MBD2505306.1 hypothetical protein [Anabaena azotica FACHB-119]
MSSWRSLLPSVNQRINMEQQLQEILLQLGQGLIELLNQEVLIGDQTVVHISKTNNDNDIQATTITQWMILPNTNIPESLSNDVDQLLDNAKKEISAKLGIEIDIDFKTP